MILDQKRAGGDQYSAYKCDVWAFAHIDMSHLVLRTGIPAFSIKKCPKVRDRKDGMVARRAA